MKVQACGLCHTDIHAARGDWPVKPSPPSIPGHEGVGIVTLCGPGVSEVAVGDRVAIESLIRLALHDETRPAPALG